MIFRPRISAAATALGLFVLGSAHAVATLPPDAQKALDAGVEAARQPDYVEAIRCFQEARQIAPQAPEVFFNLGLAEAHLTGHELRAICWFEAYLLAAPGASNAAAVRDQIGVMETKSHVTLDKVIQAVQDAAGQMADKDDYNWCMAQAAALWAQAGKAPTGRQAVALIPDARAKCSALVEMVKGQLTSGDIDGALQTATTIPDPSYKSGAMSDVAFAQAASGDIAGAQKTVAAGLQTADLITDASWKSFAQNDLILALGKSGDFADALKSINFIQDDKQRNDLLGSLAQDEARAGVSEQALKIAHAIQDPYLQGQSEAAIADDLAYAGNKAASQAALAAALKTVDSIPDPKAKVEVLADIADAQVGDGDVGGALTTSNLIQDDDSRAQVLTSIADIQAKAGDIPGALKTASGISRQSLKDHAESLVAVDQARAGDINGAQNTANLIQDTEDQNNALIAAADALARSGNVDGALNIAYTLNGSDEAFYDIAVDQVMAGDVAGAQKTMHMLIGYWKVLGQRTIQAAALAKTGDVDDALKIARQQVDYEYQMKIQVIIADAQARSGDFLGALSTAENLHPVLSDPTSHFAPGVGVSYRSEAKRDVALRQVDAGDIPGALKTIDLIEEMDDRRFVQQAIASAQARHRSRAGNSAVTALAPTPGEGTATAPVPPSLVPAGSPAQAATLFDWTSKLDDTYEDDDCALNSKIFLDLPSYLTDLPPSTGYPAVKFANFCQAARKLIVAQNTIDRLLNAPADKR
jgi:tetratricopeptide (TPR) repeat protein